MDSQRITHVKGFNKDYPKGPHGMELSCGNDKLGDDTLIINPGPAALCPSEAFRMCEVCNSGKPCYALKFEIFRPNVLAYRLRQFEYWRRTSIETKLRDLEYVLLQYKMRGHKIRWLRVSEAGDINGLDDIRTIAELAKLAKKYGVRTYLYTARRDMAEHLKRDLPFSVKGSGFRLQNGETCVIRKEEPVPEGFKVCPADCRTCHLCKVGKTNVAFRLH